MQIPKDTVVNLIRDKAGDRAADEAASHLPDQVDPEQHADLLKRFGVNPQELLSGGLGGLGDKLGL